MGDSHVIAFGRCDIRSIVGKSSSQLCGGYYFSAVAIARAVCWLTNEVVRLLAIEQPSMSKTNICLGRLQCCKFSQNSDLASSAKWKNHALNINKSLWFRGLGAGLSPWSHGFDPCCIHDYFLLDFQSLLFFHPFEPIIFCIVCCWKASSQQKSNGMFMNFILHNPNT